MVDLDKIKQLVEKYYSLEKESKLKDYNEEATKKGFIEPLFRALGWDIENLNEVSVEETISKKRVDYGFRVDGIPKFFLEAKALREDDIIQLKYVQQAIDYAWMKSCTWAILTNFRTLVVYNAEQKSSDPRMNRFLIFIEPKDYLEKIDELMLLSKESIKKGELDKKAEYVGKKELKKSIDTALLDDITNFREILYNNIKINNKNRNLSDEDIEEAVQRIIDRMIFIRNAEDRGLEPEELRSKVREWSSSETGHLLNQLNKIYSSFDKDYDSKLFEHSLCDDLKIDDNILEEVINGLYESKDGLYRYDFSLISADILGNIYEQYLGRILKKVGKTSKLEASKAKRKSEGIYYTPTYIVDYIVKNTVGEYIKSHKEKDIENIKILDPACGSGSFLLKAYDTLENYWKEKGKLDETKLEDFGSYSKKVEIVTKNIFGVDLDEKAVEIAQLNLLLKIAEKRKRLPTLQKNIKNGNSLIDDPKIAGDKAFKWNEEFTDIMKNSGFDVVIGNPPYIKIHNLPKKDVAFYKENFHVADKQFDLFCIFIEKAISLLKEEGIFGFIVPSLILKGYQYSKIREFILDNTKIVNILDLGDKVFEKVQMPTCILILEKCFNLKLRKENVFLFKTKINKNHGFKEIKRKQIDLYKDKNYIIDSTTDYISNTIISKMVIDVITLDKLVTVTRGIELSKKHEGIFEERNNKDDLPILSGEDVERYRIKKTKFIKKGIFRDFQKNKDIFENEKLLIREAGTRLTTVYDDSGLINLRTLYDIQKKQDNKIQIKFLLGVLNSKLMQFYYLTKFRTGTDIFPKIRIGQVRQLPIRIPADSQQLAIVKLADKMISLNKHLNKIYNNKTEQRTKIKKEIEKTDKEIDELVYKIYGIVDEEKKIIEESLK